MADMPQVKRGLEAPRSSRLFSRWRRRLRRNDLLYAIVTDMQGIADSHPDS